MTTAEMGTVEMSTVEMSTVEMSTVDLSRPVHLRVTREKAAVGRACLALLPEDIDAPDPDAPW
jgi:hypothetical protein